LKEANKLHDEVEYSANQIRETAMKNVLFGHISDLEITTTHYSNNYTSQVVLFNTEVIVVPFEVNPLSTSWCVGS